MQRRAPQVPLCVDLDGTLVRSDVLAESVLQLARSRPLELLCLPWWLAHGRAHLKQEVARRVRIDPSALPYNPEILDYLKKERAAGRRLVLVTASHAEPAAAVAEHLSLFDEVIATDGRTNLKSRQKREALERRFGPGGFDYAGNSAADLAVWPGAREAVVVNAPRRVVARLGPRARIALDMQRKSRLLLLLAAMRVRQWSKNLLLFVPTLLAYRIGDREALVPSLLAFLSFSLGASAVYVLNDLLDVEADRHHPRKRHRPFAAGDLPLAVGFLLGPLLAAASLATAAVLPPGFVLLLLTYFVATTLYSAVLKEIALVDVLVLASLYTLRIIAGAAASGVVVSEWLLAFSMFIFLSLAAVKRYAEVLRLREDSAGAGAGAAADLRLKRRGYLSGDLELIVTMGLSSGYIAVLVLALYITSDAVTHMYHHPRMLWFACPLLLYWITRIWLLAHRRTIEDDPLDFSVKDGLTWLVAAAGGAILLAARGL